MRQITTFEKLNDATVRKYAARALVDLFDTLYEGAFAIDIDGRVTWMNHKFKALIGWNGVAPVEGTPIEELVPNTKIRRVLNTGQADLLDIMTFGKSQVTVSRLPLMNDTGKQVGALGVILYDRLQSLKPLVNRFQQLEVERDQAKRELATARRPKYTFSDFIGATDAVRTMKRKARRAAERDMPVLLLGETGTGKELLAHAIHATSSRSSGPMVRLNVSAIPEGLLESELFGVAPGAFTGADRKPRDGKFKLADKGTLFLDEIGDMPVELQAKLLRVLQEQEFEPVGSNKVIQVNVRVISATSRDLETMIEQGQFRADLYYRLNVLPLVIPPLRDRRADIALICDKLLDDMAEREGGAPHDITQQALGHLAARPWPGNVRELRNVLEQAAAQSDGGALDNEAFGLAATDGDTLSSENPDTGEMAIIPLKMVVAQAERKAIQKALSCTDGNRSQAAKLLEISRAQFYTKLNTYGI